MNKPLFSHPVFSAAGIFTLSSISAVFAEAPQNQAAQSPQEAIVEDSVANLYRKAGINADGRVRYFFANSLSGIKDVNAFISRLRLGLKTGSFHGFRLDTEGEFNKVLYDHYEGSVPRVMPMVDPDSLKLRKLALNYTHKKNSVSVGRQEWNLDNERFIGSTGALHNDQTFDSANWIHTFSPKAELLYSYIYQINDIYGVDYSSVPSNKPLPQANIKSGSNYLQYKHAWSPKANLLAYGFWLELSQYAQGLMLPPGSGSSQTYGFRMNGRKVMDHYKYNVAFARQSDYGSAPSPYHANYYNIELGYIFAPRLKNAEISAGYEVVGSDNGKRSFQTPASAKYKFNGWTDKFMMTPPAGLRDLYLSGKMDVYKKLTANIELHRFSSDYDSTHYGNEYDLMLSYPFSTPGMSTQLRYSWYSASPQPQYPARMGNVDTEQLTLDFLYRF